jgi:hypothetical protein
MPHINELKSSNFLQKSDCGNGILVTISHVDQQNVAKEGAPVELKWCLHFKEQDKPMVLNSTNGQLIAKITGQDDTDNWAGYQIVLFNDPGISFQGKLTGGIRVRASQRPQPTKPAPVQPPPKAYPLQPENTTPAIDLA